MKSSSLILITLLLLTGICSCSGWDEGLDIDIHDPQQISWVENIIDGDLLDALSDLSAQKGISYIHWGHTPPNLDSISFVLDTLWYDTCIKHFPDGHISYNNPGGENAYYKHHFFDHVDNIAHQNTIIHIKGQTELLADTDTAYIIGSGNSFTAYFRKKQISESHGNPTYAYLVSGTLVYRNIPNSNDSIFIGIKDYRIAKKIIATDPDPAPYYCKGTLMVLRPFHENDTIPYQVWDTQTDQRNTFSF